MDISLDDDAISLIDISVIFATRELADKNADPFLYTEVSVMAGKRKWHRAVS